MSLQKDRQGASVGPHTGASTTLHGSTDDAVTLDVQPAYAEGRRGSFQVTIVNGKPWPITVTLTVCDDDKANGLRATVEPGSPIVAPAHGVAQATVSVAPMRVRATPSGASYRTRGARPVSGPARTLSGTDQRARAVCVCTGPDGAPTSMVASLVGRLSAAHLWARHLCRHAESAF